jgi:hypothetical protein
MLSLIYTSCAYEEYAVNIEYDKQQAPNVPDFVDGMRDCEKGNQADPDRSDSYQRGYAAEYQLEQNRSERHAC